MQSFQLQHRESHVVTPGAETMFVSMAKRRCIKSTKFCPVCALFCLLCALQSVLIDAAKIVYPNTHWVDTDGNRIEAHAAGMLQSPIDGRWYWYGESKKTDNFSENGVNCYSAEEIAGPWTFEGRVLSQSQIQQPDARGPFIVERPKVLFNSETKKFVMWFHLDLDGYTYRHAGIAQADNAIGPFKYVHGIKPDGINSLDMSLFQDPVDATAYFIRSCDNQYVGISRLTSDYLNSTGIISTHDVFEGMALFRHSNGTYYMISSHLTGWEPNPLILFRAEGRTLDDPQWVNMGNPTGDDKSFNTQPTYVVQYTPSKGVPYFVYMADNWVHCPNSDGTQGPLINACYTWLPINFHSDSISIDWRSSWDLDDPFAGLVLEQTSSITKHPDVDLIV
mmetsp:Transcript_23751/g.43574  ORF Transcript_23751/g.43574 Transcript_23751/m.43574 type:complete len:392 (+) Transcript_23751:31-1206(+)